MDCYWIVPSLSRIRKLFKFTYLLSTDNVIYRTCDRFATRFPEKQEPSPSTIKEIIQNLDLYEQEFRKIKQ